jgi:hypothetical protein
VAKAKSKRPNSGAGDHYWVKIVRPVFQTALIEVSAKSAEEAAMVAIKKAEGLRATSWTGQFDPERYTCDIQAVLPSTDREPNESPKEFMSSTTTEYLLLRADTNAGEGTTSPQPWLDQCSNLMLADLCGDWIGQLDELEQEGLEGFYSWVGDEVEKAKQSKPANVVPFLPYFMRRKGQEKTDKS